MRRCDYIMTDHINKISKAEQTDKQNQARLLVKCPDRPGIVAALSKFLFDHDANIIESSQYTTDPEDGIFFIRIEFYCKNLLEKREQMKKDFEQLASKFSMDYHFAYRNIRKRTAIFVSKEPHCLMELLWEWQSGDLETDIVVVISNHEDAREIVESFGIPCYYIPAYKDIRKQAEEEEICLMEEYEVDLLIVAAYMRNRPAEVFVVIPDQIIKIYLSCLPAFIRARPYDMP